MNILNVNGPAMASGGSGCFDRQAGLTLLEVLISIALGIFFLLSAVQYLVVGQQSNSVQDAQSRIQENARFATDFLEHSVRHAGYDNALGAERASVFFYVGNCGNAALGGPAGNCSTDAIGNNRGDRMASVFTADDNFNVDCAGAVAPSDTLVANVFWVAEVNGIRSLYCQGWDVRANTALAAAQPLVDGIDSMQVEYGLSDTNLPTNDNNYTGVVVQYLSAGEFASQLEWNFVRSVRVALLVSSGLDTSDAAMANNASFQEANTQYQLLDATYQPGDGEVRRVFTLTMPINNSFQ